MTSTACLWLRTLLRDRVLTVGGFITILLGISLGRAEDAKRDWPFTTLEVQVLLPNGEPAPNQHVWIHGLDRFAHLADRFSPTGDGKRYDGWDFVTDPQGRCSIRFGRFDALRYEKATGKFLPGEGAYYLVASRPDTAGAVSPRLIVRAPDTNWRERWIEDEWSRDRTIELKEDVTKLTLRFERGISVTGEVVDPGGKPLSNEFVGLHHDLRAGTHTGYGGEIFHQHTKTGADGRFRFNQVYPRTFLLSAGTAPRAWIRTRVGKRWYGEPVDQITPPRGGKNIEVRIVLAPTPPFRYHGQITDASGAPLAGATVSFGVSDHSKPRTYGDNHHLEYAITKADGTYEIQLGSRFVRGFSVEKDGYARVDRWGNDKGERQEMFAPGKYDFRLEPKPATLPDATDPK